MDLDHILAAARSLDAETSATGVPAPPGCLSFERARSLALDDQRWTPAERAHAEDCARCRRMVAAFERLAPHPSIWSLIANRMGLLHANDERALAYHLAPDGCRRCRQRAAALSGVAENVVRFPRISLPDPAAARAATASLDIVARSPDARLEAELLEDESAILLEVRTRDATLNHHLVGYSLRGAADGEPVTGFVVLGLDVEGWYAAQQSFEPGALYSALGGHCEEVLVAPVDLNALSDADSNALLTSAERHHADARARASWLAWVAAVKERTPEESRDLVRRVRESLSVDA